MSVLISSWLHGSQRKPSLHILMCLYYLTGTQDITSSDQYAEKEPGLQYHQNCQISEDQLKQHNLLMEEKSKTLLREYGQDFNIPCISGININPIFNSTPIEPICQADTIDKKMLSSVESYESGGTVTTTLENSSRNTSSVTEGWCSYAI